MNTLYLRNVITEGPDAGYGEAVQPVMEQPRKQANFDETAHFVDKIQQEGWGIHLETRNVVSLVHPSYAATHKVGWMPDDWEEGYEYDSKDKGWIAATKDACDLCPKEHCRKIIMPKAPDWKMGDEFTTAETDDTVFIVKEVSEYDVIAYDSRSRSGETHFAKWYIQKVIPRTVPESEATTESIRIRLDNVDGYATVSKNASQETIDAYEPAFNVEDAGEVNEDEIMVKAKVLRAKDGSGFLTYVNRYIYYGELPQLFMPTATMELLAGQTNEEDKDKLSGYELVDVIITPTHPTQGEDKREETMLHDVGKRETHHQLTYQQKLAALDFKYYQGQKWEPKTGDYYTLTRSDLELYQVVYADDKTIKTRYCDTILRGESVSEWEKETFLEGFGTNRAHVPDWILKIKSIPVYPTPPNKEGERGEKEKTLEDVVRQNFVVKIKAGVEKRLNQSGIHIPSDKWEKFFTLLGEMTLESFEADTLHTYPDLKLSALSTRGKDAVEFALAKWVKATEDFNRGYSMDGEIKRSEIAHLSSMATAAQNELIRQYKLLR